MEKRSQNQHWSAYWQTGSLTSLPQDFKNNYDGELLDFWRQVVKELPRDSVVMDVCTGNLALPLLISQICELNDQLLEIKAVDLAKIDKHQIARFHPNLQHWLSKISVIDETAIEDVSQFITEPVDLITSQYGLEYCETETIAPQLVKLLKPGGRLVFVAHATDTAILKSMQEEKTAFEFLQDLKVFSTLKSFGEGRFQPAYFLKQLKKQLDALHHKLLEKPAQLLQVFHQALGGLSQLTTEQLETQKPAVKQFYQQHWMAQMRSADLLWVSEKIAQNPTWYQIFESAGLVLEEKNSIWYQGKHNAGTAYQFRKPAK